MRIILSESNEKIKAIKKDEKLSSIIIDSVFSICKNDKNFNIRKELDVVDSKVKILSKKILKQESLLDRSSEIQENVLKKIKVIDDEGFKIKVRVLESLGSEL